MIEHCISVLRKKNENKRYQAYVTECLKAMIEVYITSRGGDITLPSYYDEPAPVEKEESAEDVISRITGNLMNMGK